MYETGMVVKIHQQVLHAAQCPGALIQGETDLEDPKTFAVTSQTSGNICKKARVKRIGEGVSLQGGIGQKAAFDIADILIDAAVPGDPENIPDVIMTQVSEKTDVAAQLEQVILKGIFKIQGLEMLFQLEAGFFRETTGPGDIGRSLAREQGVNEGAFGHGEG